MKHPHFDSAPDDGGNTSTPSPGGAGLKALSVVESQSSTSPTPARTIAFSKMLAASVKGARNALTSGHDAYFLDWQSACLHQPDESEASLKSIARKLKAASVAQLEYGSRMEFMRYALEEHIYVSPAQFTDSIKRILQTSETYLNSETKAAALRYLGIYDSPLETSQLSKLFISSLKHAPELEAVAAARSLADMGDVGSVHVMKEFAQSTDSDAVREATESAIKDIVETYGYSTRS